MKNEKVPAFAIKLRISLAITDSNSPFVEIVDELSTFFHGTESVDQEIFLLSSKM